MSTQLCKRRAIIAPALVVLAMATVTIRLRAVANGDTHGKTSLQTVYLKCPTGWLQAHVQNWLNDHCACVVQSPTDSSATLAISFTDRPGMFPSVRLIDVSATLKRGKDNFWAGSRNWTAAGEAAAKHATAGLSDGLMLDLISKVALPHGSVVTRQMLQRASSVGVIADGTDGADWASKLQASRCHQKIVAGKSADALLEHVEVRSGSVDRSNNITVSCSNTDNSIDCEDNMGGSSSVYCVGDSCTAYSSSGYGSSTDARPDIEITPPTFAWFFIDPKTGQPIGTWSMSRSSLGEVKAILGCK